MPDALAISGGTPVRSSMLPYAHQSIDAADIAAVTAALQDDFLTTGPQIAAFEKEFAQAVGTKEAVAVNNGTTALHCAYIAAGIQPGDEVIVPTITFAATANAVLMQGGIPVFADVDAGTLLIDPQDVEKKITKKTKAVVAVDYAGQPCDYEALRKLCDAHNLTLIADACHALDGSYNGKPVGSLADLSTFSFHPVKPLTTGEGGMITTNNSTWAEHMRRIRNHGISLDAEERQRRGTWFYEIAELGYNYRLTDVQCALGRTQLKRVEHMTKRRQEIAKRYDAAFKEISGVTPLLKRDDCEHAYHLYVVQVDLSVPRNDVFHALKAENIGVNLHYIPVHLHPLYRTHLGTKAGLCPAAEYAYERILSLPLFSSMSDADAEDVIEAVRKVCEFYKK